MPSGHRDLDGAVRGDAGAAGHGRLHGHRSRDQAGCRVPSVSPDGPAALDRLASRWRPWRSYAMAHLWSLPTARSPRTPDQMKGRDAA
jgi:3-methyladenine DNA glycosylase/8-oxoguanine DNA glycosylase